MTEYIIFKENKRANFEKVGTKNAVGPKTALTQWAKENKHLEESRPVLEGDYMVVAKSMAHRFEKHSPAEDDNW